MIVVALKLKEKVQQTTYLNSLKSVALVGIQKSKCQWLLLQQRLNIRLSLNVLGRLYNPILFISIYVRSSTREFDLIFIVSNFKKRLKCELSRTAKTLFR